LNVNRLAALLPALLALTNTCRKHPVMRQPELPNGAVAFSPPPVYTEWWRQVEECAQRNAPLTRVTWFEVPNASFFVYKGEQFDAHWWEYNHWIVLASAYTNDAVTVRHEMLHDLLNEGGHPPDMFHEKCKSLVYRAALPTSSTE